MVNETTKENVSNEISSMLQQELTGLRAKVNKLDEVIYALEVELKAKKKSRKKVFKEIAAVRNTLNLPLFQLIEEYDRDEEENE